MNTSGFYKNDGEEYLLYACNFIDSGSFYLDKNLKDTYTYPIGGWYWFDNEDQAYSFFNMKKPSNEIPLPPNPLLPHFLNNK